MFRIKDSKTRERLLRESSLTLEKTDEICHAAESMLAQMKIVDEGAGTAASQSMNKHSKDPRNHLVMGRVFESAGTVDANMNTPDENSAQLMAKHVINATSQITL